MAVDELVCRLKVVVLAPALRQQVLVLRFQHRDPPDFLEIAGEAGFGHHPLIRGRQPSHVVAVAFNYSRQLSASYPIVNLISKRYYFYLRGDHVSTRNGRIPAAGGTACANRGL